MSFDTAIMREKALRACVAKVFPNMAVRALTADELKNDTATEAYMVGDEGRLAYYPDFRKDGMGVIQILRRPSRWSIEHVLTQDGKIDIEEWKTSADFNSMVYEFVGTLASAVAIETLLELELQRVG